MKVHNNPLVAGFSGMIGKVLVFKKWRGKLFVSGRPRSRRSNSEKQEAHLERFNEATQYGKNVMANEKLLAEYKKGVTTNKCSPYHVAVSDYCHSPVVHYVKADNYTGAVGDTITIKATDDFKVTQVFVMIERNGLSIESGHAERYARNRNLWKYKTTVLNAVVPGTVIEVSAHDLAGNVTDAKLVM